MNKHNLNMLQQKDLKTHMTGYLGINLPLSIYIRKFMNYKTLGTLKLVLRKII